MMAVSKVMKKLVYIITLLLLTTGYSKAQMVIKGKVFGSDDGLPLPQVSVLISGTKKGSTTKESGNSDSCSIIQV